MEGRMDGRKDGRESGVKDCLQQSKINFESIIFDFKRFLISVSNP